MSTPPDDDTAARADGADSAESTDDAERITPSEHVERTIRVLQEAYLRNDAWAVARLARLRQGVGSPVGRFPELIQYTTAGFYDDDTHLPAQQTDQEQGIYAAITLFALHQQSSRAKKMHQRGASFGKALLSLSNESQSDDAVRRRFERIGTANSWDEVLYNARTLIQQLRSAKIPLDYGMLTSDLIALRDPAKADRVRNQWGRDFYRVRPWDKDNAVSTSDSTADASEPDSAPTT